jgi:diguanylate cyclase (GGDEF)-like protein
MTKTPDLLDLLQELIEIGIALTSQRDLSALLPRILSEAQRFARAEAGALFLRDGERLRLAGVRNDVLAARVSPEAMEETLRGVSLPIDDSSLPGYAALQNVILNVADVHSLPGEVPYRFNPLIDGHLGYRSQSVLVVPMQDPAGRVVGILELANALDDKGQLGPFHRGFETLVRALASHAAVAIENVRLEELSFKDPLTGLYNRRYFAVRLEEEFKRRARSGQPLALALIDIDRFKDINDQHGHRAGDETLTELATQLTAQPARGFAVTCRWGGDEFAVLLADTNQASALGYARRVLGAITDYPFPHGRLTVSIGVAAIPDNATSELELLEAADRALYLAKRTGGNRVAHP